MGVGCSIFQFNPFAISTMHKMLTHVFLFWNPLSQIYVSLEGVDEEKIEVDFKPTSVDIKFHDVQGKNYRCAIPKLNKEIVPEKCKLLVKPKRVVVTLAKATKGNWLDLHFKEDKVILHYWKWTVDVLQCIGINALLIIMMQLKPNLDKERDPMAGIMDLMKVRSMDCSIIISLLLFIHTCQFKT